jgi:hypothetical protein
MGSAVGSSAAGKMRHLNSAVTSCKGKRGGGQLVAPAANGRGGKEGRWGAASSACG